MEQRIASVLFYGVMLLVVLTCGAELRHLWRGLSADWTSAAGSWFGGAGSFAAAAVALYISRSEVRARREDEKKDRHGKAFAICARYFQISNSLSRSFSRVVENLETGLTETLHYDDDWGVFVSSLVENARVFSFDVVTELPFLDESAIDVIELNDLLSSYFSQVDRINQKQVEFNGEAIERLLNDASYIKVLTDAIREKTRTILEGRESI